jgi:hypothetical protein
LGGYHLIIISRTNVTHSLEPAEVGTQIRLQKP